jgi:hypothetical protein
MQFIRTRVRTPAAGFGELCQQIPAAGVIAIRRNTCALVAAPPAPTDEGTTREPRRPYSALRWKALRNSSLARSNTRLRVSGKLPPAR